MAALGHMLEAILGNRTAVSAAARLTNCRVERFATKLANSFGMMVARDVIEPPTQRVSNPIFSGSC